jgi:hypothetical protein
MDAFNTFKKVGKYEISNLCYETYPCKHSVRFESGETRTMLGDKIYSLLCAEGLSDAHFNGYKEVIRRREFPTPEEIKEREERELQIEQEMKLREQQCQEQQQIVNKYKASSRIEQLKLKHNIH